MASDTDGCEKTEYMGKENIKEDICGPETEQGIWRIRTNQELWELYEDLDIEADTKKKRLEWIGHVVCLDYGGGEENALGYGGGKRERERERVGTRRARRVEGVENYG
jgi:hypothetical protein